VSPQDDALALDWIRAESPTRWLYPSEDTCPVIVNPDGTADWFDRSIDGYRTVSCEDVAIAKAIDGCVYARSLLEARRESDRLRSLLSGIAKAAENIGAYDIYCTAAVALDEQPPAIEGQPGLFPAGEEG
jgi:hypothetical protein